MTIARSQYDERQNLASDLSFEGDQGVTKQADLKDADINAMFKKFERTGQLPNMISKQPHYGDFSTVPDYQEALEIVKHADEQFINLDVTVRNKFDNDPAKFLAFATDSKNEDEMDKMGLLNPEASANLKAKRAASDIENRKKIDDYNAANERQLIDKIKAELNKPA